MSTVSSSVSFVPRITKTTTTQMHMSSPSSTYFTSRPARHSASSKYRYNHGTSRSSGTFSMSGEYAQIPTLLSSQIDMRHELTVLNDRFAQYIDKVKRLEAQKKILETRISELQHSKSSGGGGGAANIYEIALEKLRTEIASLSHEKASLQIQLDNCEQDLIDVRARMEEEIRARKDAEQEAEDGRAYVDEATLKLCDKDQQLESLHEKYDLLKASTDESIARLTSGEVVVKHEGTLEYALGAGGDLTESLKEIRDAYEQLSTNTDSQVVAMYKKKITDLQVELKKANQVASAARAEVVACDKTIQTYMTEIEGLRNTNATLTMMNANLQESMDRERNEGNIKIQELEDKLLIVNEEMAECLGQYNTFVNMRKSFDIEIAAYRKLLEGEEDRIEDLIHSDRGTVTQSVTVEKTTHSYYSEVTDGRSEEQIRFGETSGDIDEGDINFLHRVNRNLSKEGNDEEEEKASDAEDHEADIRSNSPGPQNDD